MRFGIDPGAVRAPTILTVGELQTPRQRTERLRLIAEPELDHLYSIVGLSRYVVLLTDDEGVVVDHRGNEREAREFIHWGVWLGGVWTEGVEGTNGIGTCLAERQPVTVHRNQHFRARHIGLSCSGAPLHDADGELIGVLDVSCIDPTLSEHAHALTGSLVMSFAKAIEERLFRERYRTNWIVALQSEPGVASLLALDGERRIVGANRAARALLTRADLQFESAPSLWTIYARNELPFRIRSQGDRWAQFQCNFSGNLRRAIVTPPYPLIGPSTNSDLERLYWHPRLDELVDSRPVTPAPPQVLRGGLTPATLGRVSDFVDAHLGDPIDLTAIANAAELSPFHFARAFKQTVDLTPHEFLIRRRIAKAQQLLADTARPISEIAVAVGFADQSHLTRRFRETVGVSPGQFRKQRLPT